MARLRSVEALLVVALTCSLTFLGHSFQQNLNGTNLLKNPSTPSCHLIPY